MPLILFLVVCGLSVVMDIFSPNTNVDVIYKLSVEEFMGKTNLTLIIEDMKLSKL